MDNDPDIAYLAEHQVITTANNLYYHVKTLETNVPIDVLVANVKFPEHDIAHEENLSNVGISQTGISDLKDAKYELVQV